MVRYQIVTKMSACWDTAPCSVVDVYRSVRGSYCLHHQVSDNVYETTLSSILERRLLHRLMVFGYKATRITFGPKEEEVTGRFKKLCNEEVHSFDLLG
jgi:hypothetical protein